MTSSLTSSLAESWDPDALTIGFAAEFFDSASFRSK